MNNKSQKKNSIERVTTSEILGRTGFFENLSPESVKALSEICMPRQVVKKEVLFFEGEPGNSVFILVTGSIQVHKTDRNGKEIVIKVLKAGEMFGEVILFEKDAYPATAVALKNSTLYVLPKNRFISLLKENHEFSEDFFITLMKKLKYLTDMIRHLSSHDVEERLFMFLEEQYGKKETIHPHISKKDIAAAISATPETLSRLLNRLKKENTLIWEGKVIHIPGNK